MKRLRNSSGFTDATVKKIVDWIAEDLGIAGFDVECRASKAGHIAGTAYHKGSGYHSSPRPFVVLRVGLEQRFRFKRVPWDGRNASRWGTKEPDGSVTWTMSVPCGKMSNWPYLSEPYQYAQHKGRRVLLATRTEGLVYIAAHELRHIWQAGRKSHRGYFHNSRGQFSEVDTEAYALHMLRAWRKKEAA